MQPIVLSEIDIRVGFGFDTEQNALGRCCIGIFDAFTFELRIKPPLEAIYPRVVIMLYSLQALSEPQVVFFEGSNRLALPRYA